MLFYIILLFSGQYYFIPTLIFCYFFILGYTIEELGIDIQAGIYFKGTLRILDVEVFAEININTDPENLKVFANITMTPINWVGGRK